MFKNEFLRYKDKLYIIKKVLREEYQPNLETWKQVYSADTVLKKQGLLYLLETIPELEEVVEVVLLEEVVKKEIEK